MSFASSIHASAAPHHFDRIAKSLWEKRKAKDFSSCDLRLHLRDGTEMVHSLVVCAHSGFFAAALEKIRAPFAAFEMKQFDASSVRRIVDWMYCGEIDVPCFSLRDDLEVAAYLKISILQRQFETYLKGLADQGALIPAINIASARSYSVTEDSLNYMVLLLVENREKLRDCEIISLNLNSIYAIMSTLLDAQKKVPLVNLALRWIRLKKIAKPVVNNILKSIVISNITHSQMTDIRNSLKTNLDNPTLASSVHLIIRRSGEVVVSTDEASNYGSFLSEKTENQPTTSQSVSSSGFQPEDHPFRQADLKSHVVYPVANRNQCYRTNSEIAELNDISDPFERTNSSTSQTAAFSRPTNNGPPRVFTRSEVNLLNEMRNPFENSTSSNESNSERNVYQNAPSGFASNSEQENRPVKFYTESDVNVIKNLKDPFGISHTPSEKDQIRQLPDPFTREPVIMAPLRQSISREKRSSRSERIMKAKGRNASASSSSSSAQMAVPMQRTASEIREINQLPSLNSSTKISSKKEGQQNGQNVVGYPKKEESYYMYLK